MDALSDVLRAVRLTGAVFFDVQAADPWVAEAPPANTIVGAIFPGAEHLISYHVVTHGACWGGLVGEPPIRLEAGDIIVFPHGDAHTMSSEPGMRETPDVTRYRRPVDGQLPFSITIGGRADAATTPAEHVVCGFLGCDARPFNPLIAALPRVLRVRDTEGGAIGAFVRMAMAESRHPRMGGECVLSRLSELMFVDVVRRYVEGLPLERTDWLAGLRDRHVGRALSALHREPARPWTLELLAREAGLSRTVLAERFSAFVGQPPMQYLANWRMQLAANLLGGSTDTVAAIAERVGYESEAAFSRAFKKTVGESPTHWRRRSRALSPAS